MRTYAQKLAVVEGLIEDFRWARPEDAKVDYPEDHETYHALKEIASDIRAAAEHASCPVLRDLSVAIGGAHASKTKFGYATGSLVAIGQYVIGRWPVIRRALERVDQKEKKVNG